MIYRLSPAGRRVTWHRWHEMGGCGLSEATLRDVARVLGPPAHWPDDLTLGVIVDACETAGRELARCAAEILNQTWMVDVDNGR